MSGTRPACTVGVAEVDRGREAAALLLQLYELVAHLQSRVAALTYLRLRGSATRARSERALILPHPGLQRRQLRLRRRRHRRGDGGGGWRRRGRCGRTGDDDTADRRREQRQPGHPQVRETALACHRLSLCAPAPAAL